ncbi:hypothetical protein C0Q70_20804 [Pomacea canaliculata]|uniref:C-type lectin domain-containing protein n=1 Tax=Pomacea canaliculata TaxID=400727 RepID=A0A2T7NAQ9_POMCA|nr:hypothetical protein C0Q70_20804 [Pomacea canaliculata]
MTSVVVYRLSALTIFCALLLFRKKPVLVSGLSATSVSLENDSLTVSELSPKDLGVQTTQASNRYESQSEKRTAASYLLLSTENLTMCQDAQSGLAFTTDGAIILVDHKVAPGNASVGKDERQCAIRVTVPAGQVVHFQAVEMDMPCETSSLRVVDQRNSAVLVSACGVSKTLRDVFSYSHRVTMELKYVVGTSFSLSCDVTAAQPSARLQLEVHYMSPTKGFIQTPGWNGTALYPVLMDSWIDLEVPKGHMTILSVHHLDIDAKSIKCDTDKLTVFTTSPAKTPLWTLCSVFNQDPVTIQTSELHVRFVSDFQTSGTGFRLDELDCPYTARDCGLGAVSTSGKCYFYVIANHSLTWYDASTDCLTRGATLVSLNTPEEWRDVMSLLQLRRGLRAYIGLQSSTFTESHFYKRSWQWADGTMAYFVKIFGMTRRPACATLRRFENEPVVDLPTLWPGACDEQGFFHYMCEAQDEAALPVSFKDKSFSVTGSGLAVRHVSNNITCSVNVPFSGQHYPVSLQCISLYEWCDGQEQCVNQADEQLCYGEKMEDIASLPPPAILDFATNGTFIVRPLGVAQSASGNDTQCPGTHFRCPGKPFADLRFLRIRGVGVSLGNLRYNSMLVYLDLAQCGLTHLDAVRLPNLQILDLSQNLLTSVSGEFLTSLQNLRQLFLSNNPLIYPFFSGIFSHSLHLLDLSGVQM